MSISDYNISVINKVVYDIDIYLNTSWYFKELENEIKNKLMSKFSI